jgi:hypothetical protein
LKARDIGKSPWNGKEKSGKNASGRENASENNGEPAKNGFAQPVLL